MDPRLLTLLDENGMTTGQCLLLCPRLYLVSLCWLFGSSWNVLGGDRHYRQVSNENKQLNPSDKLDTMSHY